MIHLLQLLELAVTSDQGVGTSALRQGQEDSILLVHEGRGPLDESYRQLTQLPLRLPRLTTRAAAPA
jgi:hypothetical protein